MATIPIIGTKAPYLGRKIGLPRGAAVVTPPLTGSEPAEYLAAKAGSNTWYEMDVSGFAEGQQITKDQVKNILNADSAYVGVEGNTVSGGIDNGTRFQVRTPSFVNQKALNFYWPGWETGETDWAWGRRTAISGDYTPGEELFVEMDYCFEEHQFTQDELVDRTQWCPNKETKMNGIQAQGGPPYAGSNGDQDPNLESFEAVMMGLRYVQVANNGLYSKGDVTGVWHGTQGRGPGYSQWDVNGEFHSQPFDVNSDYWQKKTMVTSLQLYAREQTLFTTPDGNLYNYQQAAYKCLIDSNGNPIRIIDEPGKVSRNRYYFKKNTGGLPNGKLYWWSQADHLNNGDWWLNIGTDTFTWANAADPRLWGKGGKGSYEGGTGPSYIRGKAGIYSYHPGAGYHLLNWNVYAK